MTDAQKKVMDSLKVNVPETLPRFIDDEEFFIEMLTKFTEDDNFAQMKDSLEKKDFEEAFKFAHTVKGVAANLGIGLISETIIPLTDSLRTPPYDEAEINVCLEKAEKTYTEAESYLKML